MKNATIRKIKITKEGKNLITVDCPYCYKKHHHGGGNINNELQTEGNVKLSHCVRKEAQYYRLST
jgi:hypothetical protein